jgi:excisionase family DNA binding protein
VLQRPNPCEADTLPTRHLPAAEASLLKVTMLRKEQGSLVVNGPIGRRLMNVREAAKYLGLEVDTVYKKARLREVPSVKVGRALRFDVKALERFIEQHTIETID